MKVIRPMDNKATMRFTSKKAKDKPTAKASREVANPKTRMLVKLTLVSSLFKSILIPIRLKMIKEINLVKIVILGLKL